jgi:hypothetical protein
MRAVVLVAAAGCHFSSPMVGDDDVHPDARVDGKAGCPSAYSIVGQAGRYRFTAGNLDYAMAAADCASDGGHLAKIDDTVEDAFINTAFIAAAIPASSFVWIGLSDPTMTDHYVWTDGTELGAYNGFPMGHIPNDMDGTHNCVDKKGDGGPWAIYFCSTMEKGLCECD